MGLYAQKTFGNIKCLYILYNTALYLLIQELNGDERKGFEISAAQYPKMTAHDALEKHWKRSSGHYKMIMGNGKMWKDTKYVGCALKNDGEGGLAHCWFAKS